MARQHTQRATPRST